jgi:4-hydroxy-tetrahydrodipicolinate synthase
MHEMCVAAREGNLVRARELNEALYLLNRDLFVEANPIPVKWAAQQMGLCEAGIRLPLTPLSAQFQEKVRTALQAAGCLK